MLNEPDHLAHMHRHPRLARNAYTAGIEFNAQLRQVRVCYNVLHAEMRAGRFVAEPTRP